MALVQHQPNLFSNYPLPFFALSKEGKERYNTTEKRIATVALDILSEVPLYIGCFLAAHLFEISSQATVGYGLLGLACFSVRVISLIVAHQAIAETVSDENMGTKTAEFLHWIEKVALLISRSATAIFYSMTVYKVCHELGHAMMSLFLFVNPAPRIIIDFLGSEVKFIPKALTPLGERLGWVTSLSLLAAAGSLLVLVHDLALIHFAHFCRDEEGAMRSYLIVVIDTMTTSFFALSTLWGSPFGSHDFAKLSRFCGIDPVAAVIFFVSVPVIYKLGLMAYDELQVRFSTRRQTIDGSF